VKTAHLRLGAASDRLGIKSWLVQHGRTQAWLAQQIGVTTNYVNMILAGARSPSLRVAKRLEDVTGIHATKFLAPQDV